MIHINPYFLFCHVIFIDIKKRHIMIEKPTYHQIHSLIFGGGKSSSKQRKEMKDLFYEAYYNYAYRGKNVDVEKFNRRLFNIYNSVDIRNIDMTTQVEKDSGELILSGEMPYYNDDSTVQDRTDFIKNDEARQQVIRYKELNYSRVNDEYIQQELDLAVTKNGCFMDLVAYIGYNKCFSILKKFIYSDFYRFYEVTEYEFIMYSLQFISRYRLKFKDIHYDYICPDCKYVGTHKRRITNDECMNVKWFDVNGQIELSYGVKDMHQNEPIVDGKITSFSYLRFFRYGIFKVDRAFKYPFHSLINGNQNAVHLQDFLNQLDKANFSQLELSFYAREEYLVFNNMRTELQNDLLCDNWNLKFQIFKQQWELIFTKLANRPQEVISKPQKVENAFNF